MAETSSDFLMRDKMKGQGRSASVELVGKQSPVVHSSDNSNSVESSTLTGSKGHLEQRDAVHASDSEDDILDEDFLPDPKILFRRNSDVRKCVSRRSVRNEGGSASLSREKFREQRRFSSPGNSFDLTKSLNLGNDHSKKTFAEKGKVFSENGGRNFSLSCGNTPHMKGNWHLKSKGESRIMKNDNWGVKSLNSEANDFVAKPQKDETKEESENLTDLTENGKKLSRVELLLNNNLFKKHLSNHADLIKKHTLTSRRYGLRKSVSNIDISCVELDQSVLSNVTNKVQNVQKPEKDEVKNENCKQDENSPSAALSRRLNRQLRRTSLSCMDVSQIDDFLSSSLPNFKENPTKRKKVHIPTFEEFRKQRNFSSGMWRGRVPSLETSSPSASNESSKPEETTPGTESSCGLDPISEDVPCETDQPQDSVTHLAEALSVLTTKTEKDIISVSSSSNRPNDEKVPDKTSLNKLHNFPRELIPAVLVQDVSAGINTGAACAIKGDNSFRTNSPDPDDVQFDDVFIEEESPDCSRGKQEDDGHGKVNSDLFGADWAHPSLSSPNRNLSSSGQDVGQSSELKSPLDTVHLSSEEFGTCAVSLSHDIWMKNKPVKHGDSVLRSTSDVSISDHHKKRRERKDRPYKSDPFSGTDSQEVMVQGQGGIAPFQSTPKKVDPSVHNNGSVLSDTPSYQSLEELQEGEETETESDTSSSSSATKVRNRLSNVSTTSTDSGVIGGVDGSCDRSFDFSGAEYLNTSLNNLYPQLEAGNLSPKAHDSSKPQQHKEQLQGSEVKNIPCPDCNPRAMPPQLSPHENSPPPCPRCYKLRGERKETIQEIVETEISYGRDLKILRDEFYTPMKTTGLLNSEQLEMVFLNLHELIHGHELFLHKLQAEVASATNNNEEILSSVCIGSVFAEASSMFLAFENYCIHQAHASQSLEQFEKEKELLHVFLQASQRDNSLLRRMHLKSFLMVPVQRIMKYPLLLNRLYKSTPSLHKDKENIKLALTKIEDNLEHINTKAKFTGSGSFRIKRKRSRSHGYSLTEKSEVNKVALEVLGWNIKEVGDLITSRLMYATPTDHSWAAKKCKNLKFGPVHGVLLTLGQSKHERRDRDHNLLFPKPTHIQQAAVILIREKNGKYQAIRDPLMLDKCVVTVDPEFDEVFELHEWGREALVFKADDPADTKLWVQHLKQQTRDLGQWRRRRNALPNIMIKNMV